ncbi:MAG TPA: DUF502 domain-containing protein [Woeseiaceae bacterium]|nr:DUF502 domain-containing protein [Woeseiaceae bacterium]
MKRLRRYLVAGILVWLPFVVTVVVIKFLLELMDANLRFVPQKYLPEAWLGFPIPGLGLVLTVLVLLLTGLLAANFVGRSALGLWESLLVRIPIVRTVYSGVKKFSEVVLSESGQSFKRVLLIEYPRKGLYSLAFQTASQLQEVQAKTAEDVICVFLPTTPNPTSGFIFLVPRNDVIELDMSVDDAIKMIMSLGVVVPQWTADQTRELPLTLPDNP